ATAAAASVPPAPTRFSTINGCPLASCWKPFARLRDRVSAAPPAPTGTNRRTGRSGHCAADCAKAGPAAATATENAAIRMSQGCAAMENGMGSPPKRRNEPWHVSGAQQCLQARQPSDRVDRVPAGHLKVCLIKAIKRNNLPYLTACCTPAAA